MMDREINPDPKPRMEPDIEAEMRPDREPETNPEMSSDMQPPPEAKPETEPKTCPRCSAKNNPEFVTCWKCQHSFLPWNIRFQFWVEDIPRHLIVFLQHVINLMVFLFFVALFFFCLGLFLNVVIGRMTTGQYIHKLKMDVQQRQLVIRNEWPGPILETLGRISNVGRSGTVRKYFGNGQLKSEMPYKDGRPDGLYVAYHRNGRVRAEGMFKKGALVGTFKEYYDNGFLKHEGDVTGAFEQ